MEYMEKELTPQYWIFLKQFIVAQLVKKLPVFVEPESSSICSQESSTGNYPRLLNPLNIITTLFFRSTPTLF
jgi:hypothetical protein